MADEFTLSITTELDLSGARADLRKFTEDAARGITVPVRAGEAGGQGARTIPRVSAAEQAAVDKAMARVQATSAGSNYAMGGGPGGGAMVPRVDTGQFQIEVRRMRGIFEEFRQFVERPLRPRIIPPVMPGGVPSMGGLPAGGGPPEGDVLPPAVPGFTPRWKRGIRFQPIGAPVPEPAGTRIPITAATTDEQYRAMVDTLLPGPVARARTRAARSGGGGGGDDEIFGGRRSLLGPRGLIGGIAGAFAIREISNVVQAGREGESRAQFAGTPQEAALIRAQARQQQFSGLLGETIAFAPNLLDTPGAPQRRLREAQEAVALRQMRDENRREGFAFRAQVESRQALRQGGTSAEGLVRARIESQARTAELQVQREDALSQLDRLGYTPGFVPRADTAQGAARLEAFRRVQRLQSQIEDEPQQLQEAERQLQRDQYRIRTEVSDEAGILGMRARGRPRREIARQELFNEARARQRAMALTIGEGEAAQVAGEWHNAALAAQQAEFNLRDRSQRFTLGLSTQQARFAAANQPIRGQLAGAFGVAAQQAIGAQRNDALAQQQGAITANLTANIAATLAPVFRNFIAQQRAQGGTNRQLQALLGGDRLGAAIEGIRTQRDLALQEAESDLPVLRQIRQFGIRQQAGLQERIARRDQAVQRYETGSAIDAEFRQSRLRQIGTNEARIEATIDRIITDTARDARALERDKDPQNAVKRRTLGVQQLREAEKDYYRSISFGSFGASAIVGRGDIGDAANAFRKAEDRIGKSKDGGPKEEALEQLPDLVKQFMEMVRGYLSNGIDARAG